MQSYIRNKLSLKINLVMSKGTKTKGVVNDEVIDNLMKNINGFGKYIINYVGICPISIEKIDDTYKVIYDKDRYILLYGNGIRNIVYDSFDGIEPKRYIEFSLDEYRNLQLNKILK